MKIVHIVTFVSPDGAYGGPTRVALGQAAGLVRLGHKVILCAAAEVKAPTVNVNADGVEVRLFPAVWFIRRLGFASMRAPSMLNYIRDLARDVDVAHIHLARDLVTLPVARLFDRMRVPYVVQTHGMIDSSTHPLSFPVDILLTRPALRKASSLLALTSEEGDYMTQMAPAARVSRVSNGLRAGALPTYDGRPCRVLFLARLHARKRPLAFVRMAEIICEVNAQVEFTLIGPDEGEGPAVALAIENSPFAARIKWIGAMSPDETQSWMQKSQVYVLPAINEIYPMTILEAFAAGTPVVTTDSLGIAALCEKYSAAVLTDGSPAELASAVQGIISNRDRAQALREAGQTLIGAESNIDSLVETLSDIYRGAMSSTARS